MQLKCEQASLVLRANTRPGDSYAVVVTVGLLVDAQGQIMPADQTWAWLTERLGKQPLDSGLKKSHGTFAVQGSAYALTDAQRQGMAVRVRLGELEKSLHVFAPRHWRKSALGWRAVSSGQIDSVPVVLENAYGGAQWPDNPQGKGHVVDPDAAEGVAMAPLEVVSTAVFEPRERPLTASFLPLPPQSTQRRCFMGTLDEQWTARRAPYLPADTDARWFDEVAQDQCRSNYWRGDEAWTVAGMHPTLLQVSGRLPGLRPRLFVEFTDPGLAIGEVTPNLDTVWLFPADQSALLLYRVELPVQDMDAEDIATLALGIEQAYEPHLEQRVWIERLMPGRAIAAVEPDALPLAPAGDGVAAPPDISAALAILQASSDKLYAEVAQAHAEGLAQSRQLAARMGLPLTAGEHALPAKTDYAAALSKPSAPSAPFNAAAMRTGIEAEIAQASAQAMQQSRNIMQRMGMDVEKTLQQAEQASLTSRPVDVKASMARLDLPKAEQARMMQQLSEVTAQQKAVEAELSQKMGTLDAALAANKLKYPQPGLPPLPALSAGSLKLTREVLEARYAAGESLRDLRLQDLDLSGINLSKADMQGSLFEKCQLKGARLPESDLSRCQFIDCDLGAAELDNACLAQVLMLRVNLTGAMLSGANLLGLRAVQCDFSQVDGSNANLQEAQLSQCALLKVQLKNSNLSAARLNECDLSEGRLSDSNLSKVQLYGCRLNALDLRGANLSKADFSRISGQGVDLSNANLRNWRVADNSTLGGAIMDNADLSDACMQSCDLNHASLRGARMNDVLLTQCNLSDSDGSQLVAQSAYLISCDLSRAVWPGANLLDTRLRKVCLENADLRGSNLHGLSSEGVHGKNVRLEQALMTRCRLKEDLAHA
jgi:uncharacterized protein YjbI with pentapeptide repeats